MTVATDNNLSVKEYYKISKNRSLEIDMEEMWHLKIITVPVIAGALGMIKKGTVKHINKITESPSYRKYKRLHFMALLISRRFLSIWVKNITQMRQQKT